MVGTKHALVLQKVKHLDFRTLCRDVSKFWIHIYFEESYQQKFMPRGKICLFPTLGWGWGVSKTPCNYQEKIHFLRIFKLARHITGLQTLGMTLKNR